VSRLRNGNFEPGDPQVGGWPREQLERMDQRFITAVARALRIGGESAAAASATVLSRGPSYQGLNEGIRYRISRSMD
jgi:hypothetical protein